MASSRRSACNATTPSPVLALRGPHTTNSFGCVSRRQGLGHPLRSSSKQRSRSMGRQSAIAVNSSGARQEYSSLLPPFSSRPTVVRQVAPRVWSFEQPMGWLTSLIGNPFPYKAVAFIGQEAISRMTVVKLRNGKLWVYSPVALTEECREELKKLGPVGHITLPCTSPEHWYYGPKMIEAFPEAKVWSAPELLTSQKGLPVFKDVRTPALEKLKRTRSPQNLTDTPPREWGGEFEVAIYRGGPLFTEAAVLHKKTGLLIASDLLLYLDDKDVPSVAARTLAKANGVYNAVGAPVVKELFRGRRDTSAAFLRRVLSWKLSGIVPTHGSPFMETRKGDAKQAIATALELD